MSGIRVAVVGAGPTGMLAATLLHLKGVNVTIFDQADFSSKLPKAHQINARTGEIFREIGVEKEVERASVPSDRLLWSNWSQSVAGVQYAHIPFVAPQRDFSPSQTMNLAQNRLEQLLLEHARGIGLTPKLSHRVAFAEKVGDRARLDIVNPSGETTTETFDYVLACDGAASTLRRELGIEMVGPPSLSRFISCYFNADMGHLYDDHPGPVRFLASPDLSGALIGFDIASSWVLMMVYPEGYSPSDYIPEIMREFVRRAIGDDSIDFEITAISDWNMSAQVAAHFRDGPFFLLGDAAHRMPPTGGLGLNSGVQDAHNLAWKLSWVDRGIASPRILDTYEVERRLVSDRNNAFSMHNAVGMFGINKAVGISCLVPIEPSRALAPPEGIAVLGLDAERLANIQVAADEFNRQFDILNLEIGYDYCPVADQDSVFVHAKSRYHPSASIGRLLPHVWLDKEGDLSVQDVIDRSSLTLFVDQKEAPAAMALKEFVAQSGLPLHVVEIAQWSPAVRALWHERTNIEEGGAVLVRPDGHVAWSSPSRPGSASLETLFNLVRVWGIES